MCGPLLTETSLYGTYLYEDNFTFYLSTSVCPL